MRNESVQDFSIAVTSEHRLMALLALTVQELPGGVDSASRAAASDAPTAAVGFDALDADPAQLEDYLRRGMRPSRAAIESPSYGRRTLDNAFTVVLSWLTPVRTGVVATLSVALIAASVLWWRSGEQESLADVVAQSYSVIEAPTDMTLVLPWERSADTLGFAPTAGNDTPAGRAFARGLLRGRARLAEQTPASEASARASGESSKYEALGEWNVLLWASSQSADASTGFWNQQADVARRIARARFASDDAQAIEDHLATVTPMLIELAGGDSTRTKRRLADELTRFREAFAPHNVIEPIPAP